MFTRPLIVGALAYFGSMAIDGVGEATVFGVRMGMNTFYAITTIGSSLAGQSLKQWILPMLPNNGNYVQLESAFLLPALTGVVDGFVWQLFTNYGFAKEAFIVGFGSEILGSYIYDQIIKQYIA